MDYTTTIGNIVIFTYFCFIFIFQWVTNWYFGASKSPLLDYIYFVYFWYKEEIKNFLARAKHFI
jgi:hypothetical protein